MRTSHPNNPKKNLFISDGVNSGHGNNQSILLTSPATKNDSANPVIWSYEKPGEKEAGKGNSQSFHEGFQSSSIGAKNRVDSAIPFDIYQTMSSVGELHIQEALSEGSHLFPRDRGGLRESQVRSPDTNQKVSHRGLDLSRQKASFRSPDPALKNMHELYQGNLNSGDRESSTTAPTKESPAFANVMTKIAANPGAVDKRWHIGDQNLQVKVESFGYDDKKQLKLNLDLTILQDWICQIENEADHSKVETKKHSEQIDSQNSYIQTLINSLKDEKDERAKQDTLISEYRKKVGTLTDELKSAHIGQRNLGSAKKLKWDENEGLIEQVHKLTSTNTKLEDEKINN